MKIIDIKENEDGSADCRLDLSTEEVQILLQYAIINIMKETIRNEERRYECGSCEGDAAQEECCGT